jgi:surfeit locus 1 family protein
MASGYSFHPRAWVLALAAAGCAAGIALGNWQAGRAQEKKALGAQLEQALQAPPLELPASITEPKQYAAKRVAARGEFSALHTVFLDNKLRGGRPGYEVLTPLRLANSKTHVMVNRGWVQAPPRRDVLPQVRTPAGEVRIEGLARERLPRLLEAGSGAEKGWVRQNLDIERFGAETGLAFVPIVIEERGGPDDGLLREWPRPDAGIDKHESYALQWYSLAALALVLGIVFSFRRK